MWQPKRCPAWMSPQERNLPCSCRKSYSHPGFEIHHTIQSFIPSSFLQNSPASDWAVSVGPRAWPFLPKPRFIFRVTLPLELWPVGCQICIAIWDTPCPLTFLSFLCRQMSDLHCSLILLQSPLSYGTIK